MSPQKRIDAVIDIETFGLAPTAPILEIGAVLVTEEGLEDTFHRYVSLESALQHGKPDASTLLWWMSDELSEARSVLVEGLSGKKRQPLHLRRCLEQLDLWLVENGVTGLWANGSSFDLGTLSHARSSTGFEQVFEFRKERDLRTAFDLVCKPDRPVLHSLTPHCALHDAIMDAHRLYEVLYGKKIDG